MVEGLMQRFHGKPQYHCEEDDEELFESDSFSDDSDDENLAEDATSSAPHNSSGPLCEMSSLMEQLPIKRGLSKFYQGKSQSFTSLSNARCIEDLPKKINTVCRRKIKPCKSYAGLEASQRFSHVPGPCSKTVAKKATRVSSCASLIHSSGLSCTTNPPVPVFAPTSFCP